MAKLRKRKVSNGYVYDIDFTFNGKRYIKSTRTSDPRIAKQILGDIQGRIARGTFNILELEKNHSTLSEFFLEYFEHARSFKKDNTITNEQGYAKKFIVCVGDIDLRLVNSQMLDRWKSQTLKTVNGTTFNIYRRFLHAAFNVALKWNYVDDNVFSKVDKIKVEENRKFFTEAEINSIFGVIDSDIADKHKKHLHDFNKLYRKYIEFLLQTGMRRQEALTLRKEQIDTEKRVVYLEKTKGKKYRTIPLNNKAADILGELDAKLFTELNIQTVSHKFNDILKRIGLADFKLHSLRHTFATNLVNAGVDIYAVKELLGHADIRTSLVYAKANTDTLREAVDRL